MDERQRWRRAQRVSGALLILLLGIALVPGDQPVSEPGSTAASDEAPSAAAPAASLVLDEMTGSCCMTDDGTAYYSADCAIG
jgi:hypothetical protein